MEHRFTYPTVVPLGIELPFESQSQNSETITPPADTYQAAAEMSGQVALASSLEAGDAVRMAA